MTLYIDPHLVLWENFIKQLDPEELRAVEHIKFMAKELEEPQKVTLYNIPVYILWPSGAINKIVEKDSLSMEDFINGFVEL